MTIKETDHLASTPEPERVTQTEPDIGIYQMPPVPASETDTEADEANDEPEVASNADDEAELVVGGSEEGDGDAVTDGDVDTRAESYDPSDFQARPDETEMPDVAEVEARTTTDGQHGHNGEDPGSDVAASVADPETAESQDETADLDASAGLPLDGRPFFGDAGVFEERWHEIQNSFVDDPLQAVQSADQLVTDAAADLATILVSRRESLQADWRQRDDVDTEQLRVVFQRYRAFHLALLDT